MSPSAALSPLKLTLLAAHHACNADIPRLSVLFSSNSSVFSEETILRVLLCLPETTPPQRYAPFLSSILSGESLPAVESKLDITVDAITTLSDSAAGRKAQRALIPLDLPPSPSNEDLLTAFLILRAEHIDAETGSLSIIAELLQDFRGLEGVRKLHDGYVQVLSKLTYDFRREPVPELSVFRLMSVEDALEVLLVDLETVGRDLEELVQPFLAVRGKEGWGAVWSLLGKLPFEKILEVVAMYTPPLEVRQEWAAWAVGMCYRCSETGARVWEGMHMVHRRIEVVLGGGLEEGEMPRAMGDLRDSGNALFKPSKEGLRFLDLGVTSAALLMRPVAEAVRLKLEGVKEAQGSVLRQYVRFGVEWNRRDDEEWRRVRDGARWLRNKSGVLGKLSQEDVERAVLAGMLEGSRFILAKDIYVLHSGGLPIEDVEKCVLGAFGEFFDNASNGNKTRGKIKDALQTVQILYPNESTSRPLERAYRLISATHALSNYSLTLTRGQPLLPVQIRIHPDPVSLISKLLASNRQSFLQVDALISIAKDLVIGTAPADKYITRAEIADLDAATEARVIGMVIEAALGEEDFESAYAYVTTRLLPAAEDRGQTDATSHGKVAAKNMLWRTSLLAGRLAPSRDSGVLKQLEKKMELLAISIRFCPKETLPEVLGQWRRCEEEMEDLYEAEKRAEEEHAGMFGLQPMSAEQRRASAAAGIARGEEAPQSLFEVARGAAKVFSSTTAGLAKGRSTPGSDDGSEYQRERKRDVVSGMVTRGLAGGLGWVLGAQPNLPEGR